MPTVLPYIPTNITVHLGAPAAQARNVTVSFSEYVKNVVSSEIYPTWEPAALRANTLAVISYALNRVYTEHYRSRGYDFDITSSTSVDQKFIEGRNFFENIAVLVDELYTDYLRRAGFVEPLAAKFCNGVSVSCDGMSQWGSQELAQEGENSVQILRRYYGDDTQIVVGAPVQEPAESYPGTPLRAGDVGVNVTVIQVSMNRVSQNYPAIPKIPVDAIFGEATEQAVRAFQSIFSLSVDGIVGRATWYRLVQIYVAVTKLSELRSEGQTFVGFSWEAPASLAPGDVGVQVTHLQYMLSVLAQFISEVPEPPVSGSYGEETRQAVAAFQTYAQLPATGNVDVDTWEAVYAQYAGISQTIFQNQELFPLTPASAVSASAQGGSGLPQGYDRALGYQDTTRFLQYPGTALASGMRDEEVF